MYFIPKHRSLFDRFFFMHPIMRYAMTFVLLSIISTLWYFFVYRLLHDAQTSYTGRCTTLEKQAHLVEQYDQECAALQQETDNRISGGAMQTGPQHNQEYASAALLFSLLAQHQLHLESYVPEKEIEHDWYTIAPKKIQVTGDIKGILEFYRAVAMSKSMMQIPAAEIKKQSDTYFTTNAVVEMISIAKVARA